MPLEAKPPASGWRREMPPAPVNGGSEVENPIGELGFSPEQTKVIEVNPEPTLIPLERNKDKTLAQVLEGGEEGHGWVRWTASNDGKGFQARKPEEVHLQRMARALLMANAAYAG